METLLNLPVVISIAAILVIALVAWFVKVQQRNALEEDAYVEALELMAEGNERLAIQRLKVAVRENSDNISAYVQLGNLLRKKGLAENAISVHKDLTLRPNLSPRDQVRILKSLIKDYQMAGENRQGIETARQLLEMGQPVEPWVAESLVSFLEKDGQWEAAGEAVARYRKKLLSVSGANRLSGYALNRGLQLLKEERYDQAIEQFKEAVKQDRDNPQAYFHLGLAQRANNNLQEAVATWMGFARRLPAQATIVFGDLEKACYELGSFADVERLYEDLISPPHSLAAAGLALSEIYLKKGDADSAMTVLKRLEGDHGEDREVLAKKLHVMVRNGQYKQAAELSVNYFNKQNGHR